jgi:hypothetical protein
MNQKIMIGIIIALLALTTFVSAVPVGPKTLVESNQDRWPVWASINATAIAGNVTQLTFNGSTVTRTYQGYYGNITGYIVLGDTNNNTLYDWSLAAPQGEIYAVRQGSGGFDGVSGVPDWGSVTCASQANIQFEDTRLGVNETIDEDAVNRTFVVGGAPDQLERYLPASYPHITTHPTFWVANQSIANGTCAQASMYNSSWEPSEYFKEVLLEDANGANYIIYTAIIAHTVLPNTNGSLFNGFNGPDVTYDFEMMVGENGHGVEDGLTATTSTYWFYLELD